MNRFAIGLAAVWFALGAPQVLAATTAIRWTTISGAASAPAVGQCAEGYANQCPSGSCTCVEITNATVLPVPGLAAIAGRGTADVFLSLDNGLATVSTSGECTPFFGIAELTTKRAGKPSSETLNFNGVNCSPLTTANSPILGGFGIAASPVPVNGGTGYGRVTGFLNPDGSLLLTLHGPITE